MKPNKKHKDSLFSVLFNNPDVLRELYSAIEGISIPPEIEISINTLSDVLIREQVNDLSFTIDNRLVVLIEHQSTICENLPLRLLNYIGKVYGKLVGYARRFQKKLEKIPKPEFIVLYNGNDEFPDYREMRLSHAFMDVHGLKLAESNEPPLELIVHVYNINQGYNLEILKKCEILNSYSILVSKIWEYRNNKKTLAESLKLAIKYCIGNDVLRSFLMKHGSEVFDMLYAEYRLEDEIEFVKKETWEDAWEECSKQEKTTIARNALAEGYTPESIQRITGLSLEEIQKL